MSRDIQQPIRLEVTVPIIALPSLSNQAKPTEVDEIQEAEEQVRLLSLNLPAYRQSASITISQEITCSDPSTYTTRTGIFRLFQCIATVIPQKPYLLQILRASKARKRKLSPSESISPDLTEQLAFSLEYRHQEPDEPSSEQKISIQPGLTHVVIYLDEESIPNGYHVDGVEW